MDGAAILVLVLMLSCSGINANPISLDFGNNITVVLDLEKHGTMSDWNVTNNTTPKWNETIPLFEDGNGFVFGCGTLKKVMWRVDSPKMPLSSLPPMPIPTLLSFPLPPAPLPFPGHHLSP